MTIRSRTWVAVLACGLLLTVSTFTGSARESRQSSGVTIEGLVVDSSGGPLPGVRVALVLNGQSVAETLTGADGRFRFERILPAEYQVRATLAGFKTALAAVAVTTAPPVQLIVRMQVGKLTETVVVTARPARQLTLRRGASAGVFAASAGAGQVPLDRISTVSAARPAFNTENYAHIRTNPFRLTTAEPLSTFAADVDTASYANVRRFLRDGRLPPVDAVRVEELINYFRFPYPEPEGDRPVSITTEVGEAPWAPGHQLVLVGLRARPIDERAVASRNLVLLIDVSGSMAAANKLALLKTGLRMFVDSLRDDDRLAIVVYAGATGLALPSTPARDRHVIHDALENLHAGGSTNGAAGLELAYRVARSHFVPGGINRVVLATDGDFNVGVTSDGDLVRLIERERESGVFLSVLGVGTGNLKDSKMEALADKGNGNYAYLDSLHEARRVLVTEGGATLETVAKDVKFQVEFNPATVAAWRLIGYENRLLAHEDFNDDTKDGGELGAGHTVTVLYEVVPVGRPLPDELVSDDGTPVVDPLVYQTNRQPTGNGSTDLLMVKVRYKAPEASTSALMTQPVGPGRPARLLPFAASVAEFGMLLRDPEAGVERWDALTGRLGALPEVLPDAADHGRFREIVELAAGLARLR